ncbi:Os1348 family NHLP clan protein [uncultured Roseobacter sp.]|uniref:Os1348 family NHLP clan protein n=1 Tax=uncultured Roseobacter sp. TaxID=114847 RepID=UPI0026066635|nr:Os1348 family NHLP clan protein [uncultured Roseobacter sp.]
MADGEHKHGSKHLSLDDVQSIIGRAIMDRGFREAFVKDPDGTLKKMQISTTVDGVADEKAIALIKAIAEALGEGNRGVSLEEALETLRKSYLDSADGVIRPRCG